MFTVGYVSQWVIQVYKNDYCYSILRDIEWDIKL